MCGADLESALGVGVVPGSSPRVRSRRPGRSPCCRACGIISACAEQTPPGTSHVRLSRDHLRVCGADARARAASFLAAGSSPRVRSRRLRRCATCLFRGIISACAEQTLILSPATCWSWDHLRVCGADVRSITACRPYSGSSPRVRSRLYPGSAATLRRGIISACAEQTGACPFVDVGLEDHLRVCGADPLTLNGTGSPYGSSPRVRSRPYATLELLPQQGIISACAEQTRSSCATSGLNKDHLRVCGADPREAMMGMTSAGSSPRVRSRPSLFRCGRTARRIISACAEQTPTHGGTLRHPWDHLRVCGAD